MTITCSQCEASRHQSDKPHGFCSLGYKQRQTACGKVPADECPAPRSHAEYIAVQEIEE